MGRALKGSSTWTARKVAYADGVAFSTELTGEEFVEAVRQDIGRKNIGENSINIPPTTSGVVLTEDKFRDLITIEVWKSA